MRGLSEVVGQEADRAGGLDGRTLARALRRASDLARASVTRPVEGTILSVATAAALAAEEVAAGTGATLYDVAGAALSAARTALDETTAQLPALARAGVVDAGAAGYVLVLESLRPRDLRRGRRTVAAAETSARSPTRSGPRPRPRPRAAPVTRAARRTR